MRVVTFSNDVYVGVTSSEIESIGNPLLQFHHCTWRKSEEKRLKRERERFRGNLLYYAVKGNGLSGSQSCS